MNKEKIILLLREYRVVAVAVAVAAAAGAAATAGAVDADAAITAITAIGIVITAANLLAENKDKSFSDIDDKYKKVATLESDADFGGDAADDMRYQKDQFDELQASHAQLVSENSSIKQQLVELSDFEGVNFKRYFKAQRDFTQSQIDLSDEKASLSLDEGKKYAIWGVRILFLSIVFWQALFFWKGFESHYLYGILSCSFLVVLIETLAMWYLKQYRHFVDTSTHLFKIKTALDRYLYLYLLEEEQDNSDHSVFKELLSRDITWPIFPGDKAPSDSGNLLNSIDLIEKVSKVMKK